jgi:hypothetical protein
MIVRSPTSTGMSLATWSARSPRPEGLSSSSSRALLKADPIFQWAIDSRARQEENQSTS